MGGWSSSVLINTFSAGRCVLGGGGVLQNRMWPPYFTLILYTSELYAGLQLRSWPKNCYIILTAILTYASWLHAAGSVDCVAEQTVARHFETHHTCAHGTCTKWRSPCKHSEFNRCSGYCTGYIYRQNYHFPLGTTESRKVSFTWI